MTATGGPRPVCAVLDDYQGVALSAADWSQVAQDYDIRVLAEPLSGSETQRALADCRVVVAMRERTPFPASLLAELPELRLLVTTGMNNASIDLEAARALGIVVCGTPSSSEPPVELTWALILGIARRLRVEVEAIRSGGWQQTVGADLHGSTLGLLGLGKIGSRVASIGAAFGMTVQAWSEHLDQTRADECGVRLVGSLDELLTTSDFVSIHLRLGDRSRDLVGEQQLRSMRPTAVLVNTSRAEIVNQAALVQALEAGWIAAAGLDVFDQEPLAPDSPFRRLPNVLATPHLGYVTEANYRRFYSGAVEDILAFGAGEPVRVLS
jgi:phosphoglycerate dehydrogenase-like enzyme